MTRYHGIPIKALGNLPARRRLQLLALLDDETAAAAERHHGILAARTLTTATAPRDPYARQHAATLAGALEVWRPPHDLGQPHPDCVACRPRPRRTEG